MFDLPALAYAYDALEPVIDTETMKLHHTKHHQSYVDKLNAALAKHPELANQPVEQLIADITKLPADIQTAVRNHGGGHANHTFFWESLQPVSTSGEAKPVGQLAQAIDQIYGLTADLETRFNEAAVNLFGSGWAWLILNQSNELEVVTTSNQDNPLMQGIVKSVGTPLLAVDVWEHAYYLKYQNRRAEYLTNWWQVVNWQRVGERYEAAFVG